MRPILASILLLAGCPGATTDTPVTGDLTWFTTCGDPACSGYDGPYPGVPLCTTEAAGDPCTDEAAECDFESDCNAVLVCASEDPKDQTGGCPQSRAAAKREIAYLDAAAVRALADEALATRLATWRYRGEGEQGRPHVGFLIDDHPQSPAVRADGERVDLYGYTSLALAAAQAQQAEIEALRAELAALRAQVQACSTDRGSGR